MIYDLDFTDKAKKDIAVLKKSEKAVFRKVEKLLTELILHPFTGTGKPEPLKYLPGVWSRRITQKHRLVYKINNNKIIVIVLSAKNHYDNK
ncbi:MAG: Txe/YoeB family addiction module toxin [Tannerella sp.]|jgi:toxin YoeB|nr:Txe/YoeB family addiction module toxin [Tannerella sp.]